MRTFKLQYDVLVAKELYFRDFTCIFTFKDILEYPFSLQATLEFDYMPVFRHYETNSVFRNYCDGLDHGLAGWFTGGVLN